MHDSWPDPWVRPGQKIYTLQERAGRVQFGQRLKFNFKVPWKKAKHACGSGWVQEPRKLAGQVRLRFFRVGSGRKIWTSMQLCDRQTQTAAGR